jgi:DNA invertase Pin-like site-specific DNA recombinase
MAKLVRCAIYTRKSTEEGLEQEFNSLDAQREACAAYILSQKHEGWSQVPGIYDDGGFSGGNMERPGLKALLAEVAAGNVDVICVYKIDRLTRSLADFSRIVDVLDKAKASFVSVTQSFNTTTSMGRLTLNVLLSFAQFEREVTGERIRDKFAASKRKGIWMGGVVPLGYDVLSRKLIVNEAEAETVRHIFRRYLELRSIEQLADELAAQGIKSKVRSASTMAAYGGRTIGRGALAYLLKNRVYIGEIGHKGSYYPGEHAPLMDKQLFEAVQKVLADGRAEGRVKTNSKERSLLAGIISDAEGRPMQPSHTRRGTKRYRYYVTTPHAPGENSITDGWRIPAGEIEGLVQARLSAWLADEAQLYSLLVNMVEEDRLRWLVDDCSELGKQAANWAPRQVRGLLLELSAKVAIAADRTVLTICVSKLVERVGAIPLSSDHKPHAIIVPASFIRRGHELRLTYRANDNGAPTRADPKLIELLGKAELAYEELSVGGPMEVNRRNHLVRLARLRFLAPDILTGILDGRQPVSITARSLLRMSNLPVSWSEQRRELGCLPEARELVA